VNIGFRVDSSTRIGSGHWYRCIFIAEKLKRKNKIFFISRNLPGNMFNQIKNKFSLIKLKKVKNYKFSRSAHDFLNNLGLLEKKDYLETLSYIKKYKIDVLIIDHYSINQTYKKLIKRSLKYLIVIDDFVDKKHFADLYINNNFLSIKEKKKIKILNPKSRLALGPDYLLLNRKFNILKKRANLRKKLKKILVFFGSIDPSCETVKVIEALKKIPNIEVIIITTKLNPRIKNLKQITNKEEKFKIFIDINNYKFGLLMLSSDIAIGSCGVNLLERLYLGLPSLIISTAKNQIVGSLNLEKKKLIKYLGNHNNVSQDDIYGQIVYFLNNPNKFKEFSKKCYRSIKEKNIYKLIDLMKFDLEKNLKKI